MNLDVFFTPRSVAVVGASRTPGKVGHDLLANLINAGFPGEIFPINPTTDELLGRRCYPNLDALDREIDLAVVVVPKEAALSAVKESIDAGAKGVVVISSGFREMGNEGLEIEKKMVDI
ncbi:MAG: CoA-binding protein, partial [Desulfofustis sp.]|nr:CoA-binding protein [Desulfofustis sp.]